MVRNYDDNDIQELMHIVRIGIVSSVNNEKRTARVKIPDQGFVSGDLCVLRNTASPWIPEIGQWVLCIFKPNGDGDGFILGGIN